MSIANESPYAAFPAPLIDAEGRDVLVTIVKATFLVDRGGALRLAPDPSPVRVSDELHDPDDPRSSLRFPSDVSLPKRGTDVIVVGDAVSPEPVKVMDVAVMVKKRVVPLRVHGTRVFFAGLLGASVGPAAPVERVPLMYELAYGGMSDDLSVVEMRNPSGVGVAKNASDLVGKRAPQIEHPERPHASSSDRHPPVGFGAIASHWSPRREHAGTFDERWRATRMPLLPADHDARYANVAHPSLQFEEHLAAGDPVRVLGMSLDPLTFAVPALPVAVRARYDTGERAVERPPIDTLLIMPEAGRVEVVARAVFPLGRGRRVLREVLVQADA